MTKDTYKLTAANKTLIENAKANGLWEVLDKRLSPRRRHLIEVSELAFGCGYYETVVKLYHGAMTGYKALQGAGIVELFEGIHPSAKINLRTVFSDIIRAGHFIGIPTKTKRPGLGTTAKDAAPKKTRDVLGVRFNQKITCFCGKRFFPTTRNFVMCETCMGLRPILAKPKKCLTCGEHFHPTERNPYVCPLCVIASRKLGDENSEGGFQRRRKSSAA